MEKQDRQQTEEKAMNLLEDIRKQSNVAQELREQTNKYVKTVSIVLVTNKRTPTQPKMIKH